MSTNTGPVMTLANSIIGVSVLAMPFCFKECGIALGLLILLLSGIISRLACHFLLKSSVLCKRRNCEFIAFHAFGPSGKLLVEFATICFLLGTCIAFFVVIGDLGPAIISKMFNLPITYGLRSSILFGIGLFIVLPLGLLKDVESLAAVSTVTIGFYFLLVIKIFLESFPHLLSGDWIDNSHFWRPEGVLQCVPIFAMALCCQTQIFEIFDSLPIPTVDRMNSVVRAAVNICTIVYVSVGVLGYIAFSSMNFSGNILLSFAPSFTNDLYKIGFVMSIAVSFPLVIFPCRASLYSLLFSKIPIYQELTQSNTHIPDSKFKCITVGIVGVSMASGLLIPSIELVLGFVGSTIGVAICVIFPSVAFMNLSQRETNERLVAKITLLAGMAVMIAGVYGNLYAAAEVKPIEILPVGSHLVPEIKILPKSEAVSESSKDLLNGRLIVKGNIPPKPGVFNPPEPKLVINEKPDKQPEPEPPLPVAPQEKIQSSSPSAVKLPANIIPKDGGNKEAIEKVLLENPSKKEPESKHDIINEDAIKKEERELQEVEKLRKSEEEQKQQELLKKLKEHQNEQKKLLQEQEKILREMKNRGVEKIQNDPVKEPAASKPVLENIKPIKSEKFNENIAKIQSVIDNLKDANKALAKESEKEESVNVIPPNELQVPKIPEKEEMKPKKSPVVSMPLPLIKLQGDSNKVQEKAASKEVADTKQEAMGRDILAEASSSKESHREKREAEEILKDENCQKDEYSAEEIAKLENKTESKIKEDLQVNKGVGEIIKNSWHLSVPDESKLSKSKIEDSKPVPNPVFPLLPKKRDLKSVKTVTDESD